MKKVFCSMAIILMGGCCCNDQLAHNWCGDPCPGVWIKKVDDYTLRTAYGASVIGTLLDDPAHFQGAANAQNALMTGAYGQPFTWFFQDRQGTFTVMRLKEPDARCIAYEESLKTPVKTLLAEGSACWDTNGFWCIISQHPPRVLYQVSRPQEKGSLT